MQGSALVQVRRANRSISRLYNLVLSSSGLNATQHLLLHTILEAQEISQHQLSKQLSIASATLSRRLLGLRKKGLVELKIGPRGSRVYSLTSGGRELLFSASRRWESAQRRLQLALGETDWRLLLDLCERVCEAAKEAETMRIAFVPDTAA